MISGSTEIPFGFTCIEADWYLFPRNLNDQLRKIRNGCFHRRPNLDDSLAHPAYRHSNQCIDDITYKYKIAGLHSGTPYNKLFLRVTNGFSN